MNITLTVCLTFTGEDFMPTLEPYTLDFFKIVNRDETAQAKALQKGMIERFHPKSVIDFGCATGLYLTEFECKKLGVDLTEDAFNDEVRKIDRELLKTADLTKIQDFDQYDLGLCIEVLEHIPEEFTDQVIENMVNCSDCWVVTAAPPGQTGTNHVNCQPQGYWEEKFWRQGFQRDYVEETWLVWSQAGVPCQLWLIRNLMVFKKVG